MVFATGYPSTLFIVFSLHSRGHYRYGDHRDVMRDICGAEIASKVGEIWGVDKDGQLMGAWRDSGHEGLWFGIGECRSHRVLIC